MRLAVCDDEQHIINEVTNIMSAYIDEKKLDYSVKAFLNPIDLLNYKEPIDILFLDVEMPKISGFDLARELNSKYKNIRILFITGHKERIHEAFKVKAFRYIHKPLNENDIYTSLDEAVDDLKPEYIIVNNEKIYMNEIQYIESMGEGCALHLKNTTVISGASLKDIGNVLNNSFFQCHKTYIVNFSAITKFCYGEVTVNHKMRIPVSVRRRKDTKSMYFSYLKDNAKIL